MLLACFELHFGAHALAQTIGERFQLNDGFINHIAANRIGQRPDLDHLAVDFLSQRFDDDYCLSSDLDVRDIQLALIGSFDAKVCQVDQAQNSLTRNHPFA